MAGTRAKSRRPGRRKRNPELALIVGNPPAGAELVSRRVRVVEYDHVEDPKGTVRFHDFGPGVQMFALEDGSVLLKHAKKGTRLWERF